MIEEAIIKTLVYRDLFDYPLTAGEIWRFLIGAKASKVAIDEALPLLVEKGKVERKDDHFGSANAERKKVARATRLWRGQSSEVYYFLPGRGEIVQLRREREAISRKKLERLRRYAKLLYFIPWVRAAFATGALAVGNADEESDLDLLIIATPRRLWLTRFLVSLVFGLLGVKRSPGNAQNKDKVCPNMFLSETALKVPQDEQNLYTAHEVVQAQPIWERAPLRRCFLAENNWIEKFFSNFNFPPKPDGPRSKKGFRFFDWLEILAYRLQLKYMKKRRTCEIVTPERILFHPIDRAAEILPKFEKRLILVREQGCE